MLRNCEPDVLVKTLMFMGLSTSRMESERQVSAPSPNFDPRFTRSTSRTYYHGTGEATL